MFAFRFEGFVVIDLSCGFGWCGSPAYYSLAGSLINSLYQQQCPHYSPASIDADPLVGNVWCDDHTCVEIETSTRFTEANLALRKAMAAVLGHEAINEENITAWSTSIRALGLLWDTVTGTVSVPADKILKTRSRITTVLAHTRCTLSTINKLLGSVRYVSTCFPAARAFYQNVQVFATTFSRHHMRRLVPQDVRDDLRWYLAVLTFQHKFNSIPVEHFARLGTPTRDVWMDASDTGLCVLEPQLKQFIQVEFSDTVRQTFATSKVENSINARELMSAALAALYWGPAWTPTGQDQSRVCMWIDNMSAVAWLNRRSSRHPVARTYNRFISLSEFQHSFTCLAAHIPGEQNIMADAGFTSDHHTTISLGDALRGHAVADSTSGKYSTYWKQWREFCCWLNISPWLSKPGRTANKQLGCFAAYCWKYGWNRAHQGNAFGTIKLKLASLRWYHRRYIGIDLTISPDFKLLLQGIKRLSPPVHKRQPITTAFLRLLYRRLDLQQPQQRLLWGSILIGFFLLLRRSEYLRIGQTRHFYCLKYRDTFFTDAVGRPTDASSAISVTIGLEGAKNDQFGRGAWRTMHASGDPIICPVIALKHINKYRRSAATQSPFLCGDLSSSTVAEELKATARRAGVPEANYSTHSVRIGGATALLNGQASSIAIKLLGRWLSNCFEQYPTQAASSTTTLARRMVGNHG